MAKEAWFQEWFDSPYYHLLYNNRDLTEAQSFLLRLVSYLGPLSGSKMLDVACGKGRHATILAGQGFDVTGIDLSSSSIEYALANESDNLHFFQHDMRLPFVSNYFDFVFNFFTSFGYFKTQREHDNSIRMMSQSLKPAGTLVIDYLNTYHEHKLPKTISVKKDGDIVFHITKWSDDGHFYKQIQVTDAQNRSPKHLYTEKVAKFNIGDFNTMLSEQNLKVVEIKGDYELNPFHKENSPRLIIIAQKTK